MNDFVARLFQHIVWFGIMIWMCLGRNWGSLAPLEIMIKCVTVRISSFAAESVSASAGGFDDLSARWCTQVEVWSE